MMFGYKIKAMHKGCVSYAQENLQHDVWVQKQTYAQGMHKLCARERAR